jgi:hypothetical protein
VQVFGIVCRLTNMHDKTPADLARILSFAATYMEEHGRARFRFGDRPGRPMCPVAAIALARGYSPRAVGFAGFFRGRTPALRTVGTIVLRTGLLDRLPAPAHRYGRRKRRPSDLSPIRAAHELARWSDDKTLDSVVIAALRAKAGELVEQRSHTRLMTIATL